MTTAATSIHLLVTLQALEQLKQRTKNFPGGQPEEDMLRWFLRDRGLNVEEATEKLRKTTAWRQRVRPDALSEDDVVHQLSTGKGYMHDHLDVAGRPVLVVRVAKHFPGEVHAQLLQTLNLSFSDSVLISTRNRCT